MRYGSLSQVVIAKINMENDTNINKIVQQIIPMVETYRFQDAETAEDWLRTTLTTFKATILKAERERVRTKRGEIERLLLLWKHYDPYYSPNMEELVDKLLSLLSKDLPETKTGL